MQIFFSIIALAIFAVASTNTAKAVPPPDFLFNVGSQIIQVFSILTVFLSAVFISGRQFFIMHYHRIKHSKAVWIGGAIIIIFIAFISTNFYQKSLQDQAYKDWITQSEVNADPTNNAFTSLDKLAFNGDQTSAYNQASAVTSQTISSQEISTQPPVPLDKKEAFINNYYMNLAAGKVEEAYAVSKKSVPLETYKSWYTGIQSIAVDKFQDIGNNQYSFSVTMNQDNIITVYGVLMTLEEDSNNNIRIANSQVRTLSTQKINPAVTISQQEISTTSAKPFEDNTVTDETFYPQNQSLPLEINNTDFQKILDSGTPAFVLDAREDEEFEIGSFPGSTHLRSADLVAGKWIELPTDRIIYIFCWSGMRGKEVAEFLRTKEIVARYIENGASDWVNNRGIWNGGISFKSKYGEERYQRLFTLDEVKEQIASGTIIVDSRPKSKFDRHHIEGSINIPVIYTPGSELENVLAQVPAGKPVITVCDDFISCFDAKVTGIKLEKRNHEFLGRYNKPWEY